MIKEILIVQERFRIYNDKSEIILANVIYKQKDLFKNKITKTAQLQNSEILF